MIERINARQDEFIATQAKKNEGYERKFYMLAEKIKVLTSQLTQLARQILPGEQCKNITSRSGRQIDGPRMPEEEEVE